MKPFSIAAFCLLLCLPITGLDAQYFELKSGIMARKTLYDFSTLRDESFGALRNYQNGFELAYVRNFKNHLSVAFPLAAGIYRDSTNEFSKTPFYSIGAQAQLHLSEHFDWVNPYVTGGVNAILPKGGDLGIQVPLGIGLMFKVHPQIYLNVQSDYRLSVANWEGHLQHQFGFVYLLGNTKRPDTLAMPILDADGDGIPDAQDLCPTVPGIAKFRGCPDTDGDGVEDSADKCPELAGLAEFSGCPDTDGDGVPDTEDECPTLAGPKSNKGCPESDRDGDGVPDASDACPDRAGLREMAGCPDSDGDGIADHEDKCPEQAGPRTTMGCPETAPKPVKDSDGDGIADDQDECPFASGPSRFKGCPDTDGDGIADKHDACPNTPGPASNKGCPVIEQSDIEALDYAMRAVQFDLGRATLKSESFGVLDKVQKILNKYPDYNLSIAGHTDNSGSPGFNLDLSTRRAKICYEYLISLGISPSRLSYIGFGSAQPIAPNDSEIGRYLNRRVEFNLVPR
ncbi:MAG: thrombospondin type 3 repeat-containing protein [Saprospiraceae bacterium]|jgi:OOP family OmpA-OmpF porin|nr:thrombospondin type 3 repeat-containing protein [Saprospiraceae bacterium]MBP9209849.1 thrombospondin type 3 repeat-containing protein [Saprospiraceae bacterium]